MKINKTILKYSTFLIFSLFIFTIPFYISSDNKATSTNENNNSEQVEATNTINETVVGEIPFSGFFYSSTTDSITLQITPDSTNTADFLDDVTYGFKVIKSYTVAETGTTTSEQIYNETCLGNECVNVNAMVTDGVEYVSTKLVNNVVTYDIISYSLDGMGSEVVYATKTGTVQHQGIWANPSMTSDQTNNTSLIVDFLYQNSIVSGFSKSSTFGQNVEYWYAFVDQTTMGTAGGYQQGQKSGPTAPEVRITQTELISGHYYISKINTTNSDLGNENLYLESEPVMTGKLQAIGATSPVAINVNDMQFDYVWNSQQAATVYYQVDAVSGFGSTAPTITGSVDIKSEPTKKQIIENVFVHDTEYNVSLSNTAGIFNEPTKVVTNTPLSDGHVTSSTDTEIKFKINFNDEVTINPSNGYNNDIHWLIYDENHIPLSGSQYKGTIDLDTMTPSADGSYDITISSDFSTLEAKNYYLYLSTVDADFISNYENEVYVLPFTNYGPSNLAVSSVQQTSASFSYTLNNIAQGSVVSAYYEVVDLENNRVVYQGEETITDTSNGSFVLPTGTLESGTSYKLTFYNNSDDRYETTSVTFETIGGVDDIEVHSTPSSTKIYYTSSFDTQNQSENQQAWVEIYDEANNLVWNNGGFSLTVLQGDNPEEHSWIVDSSVNFMPGQDYKIKVYEETAGNNMSFVPKIEKDFSVQQVLSYEFDAANAGPNSISIKYSVDTLSTESNKVYYKILDEDGQELFFDYNGENIYEGSFETVYDVNGQGTWSFSGFLSPESTYQFVLSEANDNLGDGSVDETKLIIETTKGTSEIDVVNSQDGKVTFSYVSSSTKDYSGYWRIYDYDGYIKDEGSVLIHGGTGEIDYATLDVNNLSNGGQYIFVYSDNLSFSSYSTSYFVYYSLSQIKSVKISEINSTMIRVTYEYENTVNPETQGPYYSIDGGVNWRTVTPQMTGDDPSSNGEHTFVITGLKPNAQYQVLMKSGITSEEITKSQQFKTASTISNAQIEVVDGKNMELSFYWQPGIASNREVWLYIGDLSIAPYSNFEQNKGFNSWVNIADDDNSYGIDLQPFEVNTFMIDWLEENEEYYIVLAPNPDNPQDSVGIKANNKTTEGTFTTNISISSNDKKVRNITITSILILVLLIAGAIIWYRTRKKDRI